MTIKEIYDKIQRRSGRIANAIVENSDGKECVAITYIYRPFEPQDKQISIRFEYKQ